MPIVASDLKLRASEVMADSTSSALGAGGGGRMGTAVIAGTTENDVFPDVMPSDRTAGATSLRKVWLSPMSQDASVLTAGGVGISARPADANARVGIFRAVGDDLYTAALARLRTADHARASSGWWSVTAAPAANQATVSGTPPPVGEMLQFKLDDTTTGGSSVIIPGAVVSDFCVVTAVDGQTITYSGTSVAYASGLKAYPLVRNASGPGFASVSLLSAGVSAGATSIPVDRLWEQFEQTTSANGKAGAQLLYFQGDQVLLQSGTTREYCTVARVDYHNSAVILTSGTTNAYASGSQLLRMQTVGTLQASVSLPPFSQQAWTRSFSDVVSTPANAAYTGVISMENAGAITDRWAIVFTSTTAFYLVSERLGQLATGAIGTDFIPVNPATNRPYFTVPAAGWGTGWLPGNCIRFNTIAAAGPAWLSRCVLAGSTAAGTVNPQLLLTGDVNA